METEAIVTTETSINTCISILHCIAEGSDLQLQICKTKRFTNQQNVLCLASNHFPLVLLYI